MPVNEEVKRRTEYVKTLEPSLEVADALYQYGLYACHTDNEKEYAVNECWKPALKVLDDVIMTHANGTWLQLDEYCIEHDTSTPLVDKYYEILKVLSPFDFEAFIFYMEKNRKPNKRFYAPRMGTLGDVAQDLSDLDNGKYRFLGVSLPARTGKLIADYTPVLTKDGWKTHGDLRVGDYVVGRYGEWVKVQFVHPKHYANKRVQFADHTYIDCHENHEWVVYDRSRNGERIVETKELSQSAYIEGGNTRYRFQMPVVEPIQGTKIELPMNPYVLGVWLGDGTNRKPTITICNTDEVILQNIVASGYQVTTCFEQIGCKAYSFDKLRSDLNQFGMCHSRKKLQKHIPDIYFRASLNQRLDLLAGLIDTDGTFKKKENRYDISTSDETLKNDIVKLLGTFGWRICVAEYEPTLSTGGIQGKSVNYRISFNPNIEIPCRVERKQITDFSKQRRIAVVGVEDIEPVSGNCITVEGGVYRVGERLKLTHNSTLCIFFLAWIACKRPNSHSAMCGHSGVLAKGFYEELLNLVLTEEYNFRELFVYMHPEYLHEKFPTRQSAEEYSITLGDKDRFPTIVCRGIDGTWTGAVDISKDGYLYVDDLVRDREHSLSPTRMENTWQAMLNKCVDRENDGAKELFVGTLWSVLDPLERMRVLHENEKGYCFRRIPALNDDDESNFQYTINGFSTQYYRDMRERLDDAEWQSKYQQKPYIREGLLYDNLNYFNGILPEGDSRIVAVVDVAWGGGDSLSMPIGREYSNGDVYIFDWVFNAGAKEVTIPEVVGKIIDNQIRQCRFEGNVGGAMYSEYVNAELLKHNYKCSCTEKKAPNTMAKLEKIIAYAGDIKRKYYFLSSKAPSQEELENDAKLGIKRYRRSKEYQKAMDELCMFVTVGKNVHDDAADSITQLEMFIEGGFGAKIEVMKNPFRGLYG